MSVWLQYHNHYLDRGDGSPQLLPCLRDQNYFTDTDCDIFTRKKSVRDAIGERVLLITGVGTPRNYFLWDSFVVENVEEVADAGFVATGPGWMLSPPQRLDELEGWSEFKQWCGNFGRGFSQIDDHKMCHTLVQLAEDYRGDGTIGKEHDEFAQSIIELLDDKWRDPFAFDMGGYILEILAEANPALRDELLADAQRDFDERDRLLNELSQLFPDSEWP